MRQALHNVSPPAVPYLGNFTSDLTFADQGNPSRLSDTLINWDKCKLGNTTNKHLSFVCSLLLFVFAEAGIIRDVNLYRQSPYPLAAVPALQELLWSLATETDDALYAASLLLEPRKK
jgi:hypothetical protein